MDLTVCVPCFGRPERTKRIVDQIVNQDIGSWEAYVVGDCCNDFQTILESGYFDTMRRSIKQENCALITSNMHTRTGGWGFNIRNKVKELASGKYFIYVDNDDWITPNHFRNYLSAIKDTDYDFVYFNSMLNWNRTIRNTSINYGLIGHAEIIVKTSFLKQMPLHTDGYGHDWALVENMVKAGAKYKKCEKPPTYYVMGVGEHRENGIN
jgi:glycosyltransferase involved in cell wall biosynthesis